MIFHITLLSWKTNGKIFQKKAKNHFWQISGSFCQFLVKLVFPSKLGFQHLYSSDPNFTQKAGKTNQPILRKLCRGRKDRSEFIGPPTKAIIQNLDLQKFFVRFQ